MFFRSRKRFINPHFNQLSPSCFRSSSQPFHNCSQKKRRSSFAQTWSQAFHVRSLPMNQVQWSFSAQGVLSFPVRFSAPAALKVFPVSSSFTQRKTRKLAKCILSVPSYEPQTISNHTPKKCSKMVRVVRVPWSEIQPLRLKTCVRMLSREGSEPSCSWRDSFLTNRLNSSQCKFVGVFNENML